MFSLKAEKCTSLVLILILTGLVGDLCFAASENKNPTIVLNTTGYAPLSTPDQKGVMDLIAIEAFRRCGYTLKLQILPAERALRHANKGITDGELARIKGMEKIYPNLVRVPEKLIDWYFVAFSKKQITLDNGWQDLANQRIAFITGWKIYEKNVPTSAIVTQTRNGEQLFTLLERNRTDIALYNRASGLYQIHRMKIQDITELSPPLAVHEMFIYLNKKHLSLVKPLAAALAEMKKDGSYDRLAKNHGM